MRRVVAGQVRIRFRIAEIVDRNDRQLVASIAFVQRAQYHAADAAIAVDSDFDGHSLPPRQSVAASDSRLQQALGGLDDCGNREAEVLEKLFGRRRVPVPIEPDHVAARPRHSATSRRWRRPRSRAARRSAAARARGRPRSVVRILRRTASKQRERRAPDRSSSRAAPSASCTSEPVAIIVSAGSSAALCRMYAPRPIISS